MHTLSRDPIKTAARLAAIVNSSQDAIVTKNLSGVIETWNPGAERIFGYSRDEAAGQSIRLIIPSGLQAEEDQILERVRKGERVEPFETIRQRKDGTLLEISISVSPLFAETGNVIGASKIARDITAQKRNQRAVLEAQNRLIVTLNSIGDAVLATDTNARVTYLNPVAESLLGYQGVDVIGRTLSDVFRIVNEHTGRLVANPVDRVLQEGRVVGLANHTLLVRPDGSEISIADSASPVRDAEGNIIGVVLVFRDVSAEQRTARMAALLAAIVDSSDDAIISKDFSGTITSWNAAAERIFGYSAGEVIGQSIRLLIPPDRQNEEADILARLSRGERITHYQTVRRKKNGQLCDISITASPIKDAEGRLLGASKIARDITELKRAQTALYESQERWRVTLESIGDGVIATDVESRVTFANATALEILGRKRAAVVGARLADVFPIFNQLTKEPVPNPVERVVREGKVIGLANHTILRLPDGSEVPIADSAAPIHDSTGRLVGVVLVFRKCGESTVGNR
jgi:PAS domain S-box-containing protein